MNMCAEFQQFICKIKKVLVFAVFQKNSENHEKVHFEIISVENCLIIKNHCDRVTLEHFSVSESWCSSLLEYISSI